MSTELAAALAEHYGTGSAVISGMMPRSRRSQIRHETLDVTDHGQLYEVIERHRTTQIYHLAAALSAAAE